MLIGHDMKGLTLIELSSQIAVKCIECRTEEVAEGGSPRIVPMHRPEGEKSQHHSGVAQQVRIEEEYIHVHRVGGRVGFCLWKIIGCSVVVAESHGERLGD